MTTFLTQWGRFKFLRAPMGLSSTGDEYCRRGAEIINGLENCERVMDDTLIYDDNLDDHYQRVRGFLQKCRDNNITLNQDKFQFAKQELNFVGYVIGQNGLKVDPEKIESIKNFPTP